MVYGYIRVSTDKQDTENQKSGVILKAESLGLSIDSYITDDGISGTKEPEERKLGKLLKKIKEGDVIITSELSRLGRKLFMIMRILEHCMNVGAKVYTVKDGYELGDNIQSKVLAFAFSLAAEIERNMISERTKEALKRKKNAGMILGRPIGRTRDGGNPKCEKNRDKIIALRKQRVSISAIARIIKVHRLTLSAYLVSSGLEASKKTPIQKQAILEPHREIVKDAIQNGLNYKEIRIRCNKQLDLELSESSYRTFISKRVELYDMFTEIHQGIRIKANGGMKVNKRYAS